MIRIYFLLAIILIVLFHHFNSIFAEFIEFKRTVYESRYFDNLNENDLILRNSTINEYRNKYVNAYREFTLSEKIKIWNAINSIPKSKIHKIIKTKGWNIVKLEENPEIEYGFPHTIGDIIILRNLDNLQRIIMHELVHIYQRYYKEDSDLLLEMLGFVKVYPIDERDLYEYGINVPLISNPDTYNDYYYKGWLIKLIYDNGPIDVLINLQTREVLKFSEVFEYIMQGQPHEICAELITRHLLDNNEKSPTISYWLSL
jgi:hypothetical protein